MAAKRKRATNLVEQVREQADAGKLTLHIDGTERARLSVCLDGEHVGDFDFIDTVIADTWKYPDELNLTATHSALAQASFLRFIAAALTAHAGSIERRVQPWYEQLVQRYTTSRETTL